MGNLEKHKQELLRNLEQKGYSKEKAEALKESKKEIEKMALEIEQEKFDVRKYLVEKPKEVIAIPAGGFAEVALKPVNQARYNIYYGICYNRAKKFIAAYEKVYGVPED